MVISWTVRRWYANLAVCTRPLGIVIAKIYTHWYDWRRGKYTKRKMKYFLKSCSWPFSPHNTMRPCINIDVCMCVSLCRKMQFMKKANVAWRKKNMVIIRLNSQISTPHTRNYIFVVVYAIRFRALYCSSYRLSSSIHSVQIGFRWCYFTTVYIERCKGTRARIYYGPAALNDFR